MSCGSRAEIAPFPVLLCTSNFQHDETTKRGEEQELEWVRPVIVFHGDAYYRDERNGMPAHSELRPLNKALE